MFVLQCASPFWSAQVNINVESGPDFIVKSMPENLVFKLGETANMTVAVKNIGAKEGELKIDLQSPGLFEEHYQTWVDSGQELNVKLSFLIPEDIAEDNYPLYLTVDGTTYETHFLVQGIKLIVSAALDKRLQAQNDTAVFTLSIQNLQDFEVTLFSRVKLGDYDNVISFSLTASETKTLEFSVPITFDAGKLLYSVYSSSGRSVYINSKYIIQEPPEAAGIILYTDKEVYESGETATIYVTTTKAGTLVAAGPGLNINTTLEAASSTFTFAVPLVRTGEYSIDYSYGEFNASYPIDIIGYTARITNSATDKQNYRPTDVVKLNATVDVNRPFSGQIQVSIIDMNNTIVGETVSNHTFTAGENALSLYVPINATLTGQHYALLKTYAFGSYIFLVSSARYFDVTKAADLTPPTISYVDVTNGLGMTRPITVNEPINVHAIVSDDVGVAEVELFYRRTGETSYTMIVMQKCPSCIDTYNATIPAYAVSTATIEYYINATDGTNFSTYPSLNPTSNPLVISVNLYPSPVALSNPTDITESSMWLNWTRNTDNDFKNYTIYESQANGTLGTAIHAITQKQLTNYTVTGLSANTTYYFTVRVFDTSGLYSNSNQVKGKTTINLRPSPVTMNSPTNITENSLQLSWTESTDNDFSNYTIYQSTANGTLGAAIYGITQKQLTHYTVQGLLTNTTYYFTTRVFDTSGLSSDSNQVKGTTLTAQSSFPWVPLAIVIVVIAIAAAIGIIVLRTRKSKSKSAKPENAKAD
jgi:chitodextrinase